MNRNQIETELAEVSGCRHFCKKAHICEYLGITTNTVNEYLQGVSVVNGKLYRIDEVAEAILDLTDIVGGTERRRSDEQQANVKQ